MKLSKTLSLTLLLLFATSQAMAAATFFWRAEGTTFSGTDDHSAGDSTPTASGSPTISSAQARVGTNSVLIDASAEYYAFDKASIISIAEGAAAFSFYAVSWEGGVELLSFRDTAVSGNSIKVITIGTDELRLRIERDGWGTTDVSTTTANVSTGAWYGVIIRWHQSNQDARIEVYNSSDVLQQGVENLAVSTDHWSVEADMDELRVGDIGGLISSSYHLDNIMVADTYSEALEDEFTTTSYASYGGGGGVAQVYSLQNPANGLGPHKSQQLNGAIDQ